MTQTKILLLPAVLAAGTVIGAAPASALELGELQVESTLGEPLRASIAYALAPNEELAPYCSQTLELVAALRREQSRRSRPSPS